MRTMNQDIWDRYYCMLILKSKVCKHRGKKGFWGFYYDSGGSKRNIFTERNRLWHPYKLLIDYGIYK